MEIIINKDQAAFHTTELTPAHVYVGTTDFAVILSDMEAGKLPVGTGKPFPVEFDKENDTPKMGNLSPWIAQQTNMPYNPQPVSPAELFGVGF